jgi:hypothetical protein
VGKVLWYLALQKSPTAVAHKQDYFKHALNREEAVVPPRNNHCCLRIHKIVTEVDFAK